MHVCTRVCQRVLFVRVCVCTCVCLRACTRVCRSCVYLCVRASVETSVKVCYVCNCQSVLCMQARERVCIKHVGLSLEHDTSDYPWNATSCPNSPRADAPKFSSATSRLPGGSCLCGHHPPSVHAYAIGYRSFDLYPRNPNAEATKGVIIVIIGVDSLP